MGRQCSAGAVVVAALLALAGCAPGEPVAPQEAPAPPLTGSFDQGRSQVERRLATATLTLAGGAEPVEVTALELLVPGFTSAGPAGRSTRFEPGRTIALPAEYGTAACDAQVAGEPVEALVTVEGSAAPVRVALEDPDDRAGGLRERECAAQRAGELAPLAWQPAWTTEGSGAALVSVGRLDVGPVTGDQPVTVEGLAPTTLFRYEASGPLTVAPGERATLVVRLTPARCDPHAVAEDKLGFAPRVDLRVGEEVLTTPAWVPREQRALPLEALLERCAAG